MSGQDAQLRANMDRGADGTARVSTFVIPTDTSASELLSLIVALSNWYREVIAPTHAAELESLEAQRQRFGPLIVPASTGLPARPRLVGPMHFEGADGDLVDGES